MANIENIMIPLEEPAATKPTIIINRVSIKYKPNKRRIAILFDFKPIIKTCLT